MFNKKNVKLYVISSMVLVLLINGLLTQIITTNDQYLDIEVHVTMRHYRDGILISTSHHAGVLTTAGQDWIEDQLGDSPSTDPAKWIGLSNSTDSPNAGWTEIPDEITTGNMSRSAATYTSTGVGTWNQTFVFNPSEANSTRLVGIYYTASGAGLLFSDTISPVDYLAVDTLEIEASLSVS